MDALAERVLEHVRTSALGLDVDSLSARLLFNPGGNVNANFTITDGSRSVHLKLSRDPGDQASLRRWQALGELLVERYRAPRMISWMTIDEWQGPVFEHVEGSMPEDVTPSLADEVLPVVRRLHGDRDLARHLPAGMLRDSILRGAIEICEADLDEMEADGSMPEFGLAHAAWMRDEVRALRAEIEARASFDGPSAAPIHGDLWAANILTTADGFRILDWDDLHLGDPAFELAYFLFTPVDRGADPARWLGEHAQDAAFVERFELGTRATLLLCVVDPLADHAEADRAPAHAARMREQSEGLHRWAIQRYRERWT